MPYRIWHYWRIEKTKTINYLNQIEKLTFGMKKNTLA